MSRFLIAVCAFAATGAALTPPLAAHAFAASADVPASSASVKQERGKYFDAAGNPTYHVGADGAVDWYTFSGFRRYNSSCIVCHGPDGGGSSFAPALANSLKTMSYADFYATVAGGRVNVTSSQDNVMPAFGTNKNVMCYLDDIYVYLRGRADGVIPNGRPAKNEPKSNQAKKDEDSCMGP